MQITKNDKIVFDTNAKSVQLFPTSSRIVLSNYSIAFPDLIQSTAYHRYTGAFIGGGQSYCESWSTFLQQEWGPNEVNHSEQYLSAGSAVNVAGPTTRNLPQTLLGTVPAETDYLDIRVRLTRTVLPAVMWDTSRPYVLFQEGEWINLPGGSCPTEMYQPMLFRHFDIVKEGTNVYLRRYQSVGNKGTYTNVMPSGGPIISSDANVSGGWTVRNLNTSWPNAPGTSGSYPPIGLAWLGVLTNVKGPDLNGNKRSASNGTNPCLIAGKDISFPNMASTYTGDIIIHPGRYQ